MTQDDYVNDIIELIGTIAEANSRNTPKEELSAASGIVDGAGLSSIEVMELVEGLEDRHDLSIPLNDLEKISTIGELAEIVSEIAQQQSEAKRHPTKAT